MKAIVFVAFSYLILLGSTAYVAFVMRPLPEEPPAPESPEWKMQAALNNSDTATLGGLLKDSLALSLPNGDTITTKAEAVVVMERFLQHNAPAQFQWWDFEEGYAIGKLYTPQGTYHLEFEQQYGQFVRINCKRA